jgi:fructose-bisphosphate aldolase class I
MRETAKSHLKATVAALLSPGQGILAADESFPTIGKRFTALKIPSTKETRREYRELLFTTPRLHEWISGVILFDETTTQRTGLGESLPSLLTARSIIPGVKVDRGTVALPGFPGEKFTSGLDGLRERLLAYRERGIRFAKWRAVLTIGEGLPTPTAIAANARQLALYAALCQEVGLVPIVEPEILMDGNHPLARCEEATHAVLQTVFTLLAEQRVWLPGMLLKTGMVLSGKASPGQADTGEVAEATLRCLHRSVPSEVPGVVFLSGGQSDVAATERLNAICQAGRTPWKLTFSFGRALQNAAMKTWAGSPANRAAAQAALLHRARCNGLAVQGQYSALTEREAAAGNTDFRRDQGTLPVPADPKKNMKTPKSSDSRGTVRPAKKTPRPQSPLVRSPAEAKRESTRLRRGREQLESAPTPAETDIRSSLI